MLTAIKETLKSICGEGGGVLTSVVSWKRLIFSLAEYATFCFFAFFISSLITLYIFLLVFLTE